MHMVVCQINEIHVFLPIEEPFFPYTLYHICYRNSKHFFLPGNNSDLILICSNKTGNKNTLSSLTTAEGKSDPCGRL